MANTVGIDLGTTNSVIAFTELGRQRCVKVESNEYASAVMPSCVALTRSGEWVVGARATREPMRVREFKRHMGEDHVYELGGESYTPVELSAMVLRRLKEGFEERHGPIDGAIITVPAMFDERRRRETMEAGRVAGLRVLRVINEPSAAAIAYTLDDDAPKLNTVVVDWGGGTLDVSVVDAAGDVLDVLCNDGDVHLGGRDLDALVLDLLVKRFRAEGHDVGGDPVAMAELVHTAERIKIHLSDEAVWDEPIALRSLRAFVEFELTRDAFEELIDPLLGRVFAAIERTLEKNPAGALSPADVGEVILVGGTCRLPLFQRRVAEYFGKQGRTSLDPMEVVALGAAFQAQHAESSAGAPLITLHSLTMNLGVASAGVDEKGVFRTDLFTCLLTAGTKIPAKATESFLTMQDGQSEILIRVFELPWKVKRVTELVSWDEHLITCIPPAPAGSFPIYCTFAYGVDQTLTVTVEIPEFEIEEEWVPRRLLELEERRPEATERVDRVFGVAEPAVAPTSFADALESLLATAARTERALGGSAAAPRTRAALGRLLGAIGTQDLAAARAAETEIERTAAEEGLSL